MKVLMTGARLPAAIDLARQLKRAGNKVLIADSSKAHPIAFSNAIDKFFLIPSPRFHFQEFAAEIIKVIKKERVDLLIPIWEEVLYLAKILDRIPPFCKIFCSDFELVHALHNKWLFYRLLKSLNIKSPHTFLITDNEDIRKLDFSIPYVLKGCYTRGARKFVVDVTPETRLEEVSPEKPWIAQEFLQGDRLCSYSVCHRGRVFAHALYPVQYTMDGSSCLSFEQRSDEDIFRWIELFAEKTGYTGQIAFDFIKTARKELFAIECNPRTTSGVHLFSSEDRLDRAFFRQNRETIIAKSGRKRQITTGMLLYGWKDAYRQKSFLKFLARLFTTSDVIFSLSDPKPFFCEPLMLIFYWRQSKKMGKPIPLMFTYDLEWDDEPKF